MHSDSLDEWAGCCLANGTDVEGQSPIAPMISVVSFYNMGWHGVTHWFRLAVLCCEGKLGNTVLSPTLERVSQRCGVLSP
ncbi:MULTISPECIES: hypothetical protein [Pectobacterium]|uniref:Uncharacterized protein n=1 Tax=Pectobacterium jejuense TaxID=2974022 RepID=A0ABW8GSX0_9GAMM|nr:hypothetical protein [Pectobacterium sp. PL64]UMO86304.1 hypothetical protein HP572_12960 [Pectobacterium sp. PL64]